MEKLYANPVISVKMLGEFLITDGTSVFEVDLKKHCQLTIILQYLLLNRNTPMKTNELIDLIWHDEKIDNPSNALKNLIYRLRNLFAEKFNSKIDFIIHKRGGYMWNDTISTICDVDEFLHFYEMGMNQSQTIESQIKYFSKAIEVYNGDFLAQSNIEDVIVKRDVYKQIYINCIAKNAQLLFQLKNYNYLIEFTKNNLKMHPLNEDLIYYYLSALINDGRLSDFYNSYERIEKYYKLEMNVDVPAKIIELYTEFQGKNQSCSQKITAEGLISILSEKEVQGAYYCQYDVFKNYYRLQLRNSSRTNTNMILLIASVNILNHNNVMNSVDLVNVLRDCCISSLRKGDAVSQFGEGQIMSLINNIEEKDIEKITKRIKNKMNTYYTDDDIFISFNWQKVT